MRIAILSVTTDGALLAQRLAGSLEGDIDIFAKSGRNPALAKEYEHLGKLVSTLFHQYDGFVFIMPVGIVVRIIAPHVRDKRYDPAVIAVDENGNFAISLLSGHISGANALTRRVAEAIGAQPVVTATAGVLQKPAIDILAVKINAALEPFDNLRTMNAAIEKGDSVSFFIDSTLANYETYVAAAEEIDIELLDMKELAAVENYDAAIVITDKDLYMVKPHIFLRPASLVVGISCRPGTASSVILRAIADACKKAGRSMKSIAIIASSVGKEDEIGVLATAQQIEVPVRFFSSTDLRQCIEKLGLKTTTIVNEETGAAVDNVSEAAALVAAKTDGLILEATLYENVMVAIAEAKALWWE